ncbi:hypothetical protein ERUR111494_06485 [Erysipelothrix urinaevulpis]|uniref:hypothetical protein n=1 Tax=Erysipelothrix urinaevulpis TaxID=2683717 RepID=UPI001356F300|nr:hypothetical protein [Erysipelothrix urinaevulpis]
MEDKLQNIIKEQTFRFLIHRDIALLETDANTLSIDLKLDRANVSRTLNHYWRQDQLIKIKGRPTFFLDKEILMNHYGLKTSIQEYASHEDLLETLIFYEQEQNLNYHFKEHIGSRLNESMVKETEYLIDYFDYPLRSYIIHMVGNRSTGKLSYCDHIYRYFKTNVYKSENVAYQILNCQIHQDSLIEQLNGLKQNSATSFIVFHRTDSLTDSLLNQLMQTIEHFNETDDGSVYIFTSRKNSHLPSTFYTHPVNVPDFKNRRVKDKMALIFHAFEEEAKLTKIPILLRRNIINCFLTSDYERNIAGLNNEIRNTCIRAHSRMKKEGGHYLDLSLEDLSDQVIKNIKHVNESVSDLNKIYDRLGTSRFYIQVDQPFEALKQLESIGLSNRETVKASHVKSRNDYLDDTMRKSMKNDELELDALTKNIMDKLLVFLKVEETTMHRYIHTMAKHIRIVFESKQQLAPQSFQKYNLEPEWNRFYSQLEKAYGSLIPMADKVFLIEFYEKSLSVVKAYRHVFIYVSHWTSTEAQIKEVFPTIVLSHFDLSYLNSRNQHTVDGLLKLIDEEQRGKTLILMSDSTFTPELIQATKEESSQEIEFISNITLNQAKAIYSLSKDPLFNIDQLKSIEFINYSGSLFNQLSYGLKTSLKIFDATKVTEVLVQSYYKIINDLNLVNDDDSLGHYVYEAAFAFERVLIDQKYIINDGTSKKENRLIRLSIENSLIEANSLFGRSLPQHELNHLVDVIKHSYDLN